MVTKRIVVDSPPGRGVRWPTHLRQLVAATARHLGIGYHVVARMLSLNKWTVKRIIAHDKLHSHSEPALGYKAGTLARNDWTVYIDRMRAWINFHPLEFHKERAEVAQTCARWMASETCIRRNLTKNLKLSRKKISKIDCRRDPLKRLDFMMICDLLGIVAEQLVSIDQTGADWGECFRRHGYSEKNVRIPVQGRFTDCKRISTTAAISVNGLEAICTIDGTWDALNLLLFVEYSLLRTGVMQPYPGPNSIFCFDNASIHHAFGDLLVSLCAQYGVRVLYLPRYSPDMQPIEAFFGRVKDYMAENMDDWVDGDDTWFKVCWENAMWEVGTKENAWLGLNTLDGASQSESEQKQIE
eukprot:CAMPEP_0181312432 /NCGR_PEP_ID=MMETSP1101-20121128/13695_1 /TAXON_ID=46948 /ORGANISM="Rhodomonas abbreviata, Strain Caron Lab Isolate" /LENGTH=354 /DNA_ID=CAMNT_0023419285 /DNA_START=101 /DNA_END=1163 /DNA_ORIENTATION=+